MENRKSQLIDILQKDLSPSELVHFYQTNHIIFERVDLFRDFIIGLMKKISATYLGDAIMPPPKQMAHFKWCWNQTVKDFEKEHIYFNAKGSHYKYFLKYFMNTFYNHDDKDFQTKLIIEVWLHIMSYLPPKRSKDLGILLSVYEIMNKNLVFQ